MVNGLGLEIARGHYAGGLITHINKFGYNPSVGTSYAPITDLGTHNLSDTATVVSVVSASADDDAAGTGARTLEIQGLDGDYALLTETIDLDGTTTVTTTNTFLRIFRMRVLTAGTGETNAGNITATINSLQVARIAADAGQTLMAVYTVPAGKFAYLLKIMASVSKNQEVQYQLRTREPGGAWQVRGQMGTFAESLQYEYPVPPQFPPKTDIQIRAKAGATSEIGAMFDLIME